MPMRTIGHAQDGTCAAIELTSTPLTIGVALVAAAAHQPPIPGSSDHEGHVTTTITLLCCDGSDGRALRRVP